MPMEMVEWELFGVNKKPTGMASAFSNHSYFKKRCKAFLNKIKKRINEVVTNNETLKLILDNDIEALEIEIGRINKKTNNDIEIIAHFYMLVAHLLGWTHSDGEIYHTPIFYQTKSQQEEDLRKSSRLHLPSGLYETYKKRQIIKQLLSEGNKYSTIAVIMGMTETNIKHIENAQHIDEMYKEIIERKKKNNIYQNDGVECGIAVTFLSLFGLHIFLLK